MARKKETKSVSEMDNNPALDYKVTIKCKNTKQKDFLRQLKDKKNEICFGIGSAGSGKSYISLAYALDALKDKSNHFNKIIVIVPTCEAGNMSIGYLRGGIEDKTFVYQESDAYTLEKILQESGNEDSKKIVKLLNKEEYIEYRFVNFLRGYTFDNCIVLINEAENFSKEEMLLMLTRMGNNCKYIITGDIVQMDRKDLVRNGGRSGFIHAIEKLSDLSNVSQIEFSNEDIVRNPLIQKIIERWK